MEPRRPFQGLLAGQPRRRHVIERTGLDREETARLAEIGALRSLGLERRAALWEAARAVRPRGALYAALPDPPSPSPSPLPAMTPQERLAADYTGTGLTLGPHPTQFHRRRLSQLDVARARDLPDIPSDRQVRVAGAVVVRQRPGTAKGFVVLSLEDETGLVNVIVRPALFWRHRLTITGEPFLPVEGALQHEDGVTSIRAEHLRPLRERLEATPAHLEGSPSHDFH